jgi:DNA-binding response OmpR family regulator
MRGALRSLDGGETAIGKYVNPKGYVVVLEDDPLIRSLLERWLGEAGYVVPAAALRGEARPVLVIADVPEPQSADNPIRLLREYAAPILLLSARFRRGLAGSVEAAHRLGVKKVLPKPFTRKELLAAVRESVEA